MKGTFSIIFDLVIFLLILAYKSVPKDMKKVEGELDEEENKEVFNEEIQDEIVFVKAEDKVEEKNITEEIVKKKEGKGICSRKMRLRNMILSSEILGTRYKF